MIAALQRLEHDEIAGYGCARTWASLLGYTTAASELLKTLTEERRFDDADKRGRLSRWESGARARFP